MNAWHAAWDAWLRQRAEDGLLRQRRAVTRRCGAEITVDGRACINFAGNDYLGLADDPLTRAGAARALRDWGTGAGASRLISGDSALVRELEDELAAWKGCEAALVFPAGYMANLGALSALAARGDTVIIDRLAHASLVDGARLSGARLQVFPHNDVERLRALLQRPRQGRTLVVTESVFSMDGDRAPLAALAQCCQEHQAALLVDEAHALGVYGDGRGCVAEAGLARAVDVTVGTLSKALGSQGGFVAGSRVLVDYLVNTARAFVYTTGIAPAAAGAALAAVRLLRGDLSRIQRLWYNTRSLRLMLAEQRLAGEGPICPLMVGASAAAVTLAERLFAAGFWAPAIRPPTVPAGTARLRLTVSAVHTDAQIAALADAVRAAGAEQR